MDVEMAVIESDQSCGSQHTHKNERPAVNAKIQLIACTAEFHWIHTDSEKVKCEINFNTRTKWIAEIKIKQSNGFLRTIKIDPCIHFTYSCRSLDAHSPELGIVKCTMLSVVAFERAT